MTYNYCHRKHQNLQLSNGQSPSGVFWICLHTSVFQEKRWGYSRLENYICYFSKLLLFLDIFIILPAQEIKPKKDKYCSSVQVFYLCGHRPKEMGSLESIMWAGRAVNCFGYLASKAQGLCQFPVATTCYPTGCVGVSAGPPRHPLYLQTLLSTQVEGPTAEAGLTYKADYSCLQITPVISWNNQSWTEKLGWLGWREKTVLRGCAENGEEVGKSRKRNSRKQVVIQGSTVHSRGNTLDPKCLAFIPRCACMFMNTGCR